MSFVVPAVLPSSRRDLEDTLKLLTRIPEVSRIQIDVVDGKFVSPPTWPYTAPEEFQQMVHGAESLPARERVEYEIDLMCADAEHVAGLWLVLGASRLTFHVESVPDIAKLLENMHRRYGSGTDFASNLVSFGVAIDFQSDLDLIEPLLGQIDYVQCMGIAEIGRQGEPFDSKVYEQVRTFHTKHPEKALQVDGGVNLTNAKELLKLGVTNLVVGSAILRADDPIAAIDAFEALQSPYGV